MLGCDAGWLATGNAPVGWTADGYWWRWGCTCGATVVIVPPHALLERDTEDETERLDPEASRSTYVMRCPWCGEEDHEDYAMEHCSPDDLRVDGGAS